MPKGPSRLVRTAVLAVALLSGCADRRDPITIENGIVSVHNQTTRAWRNVVVTVNDHFRAGAGTLAAGGRLTAPLAEFQTAFGQKYDRARQSVFKVDVTATDEEGQPVKVTWTGKLGNGGS